ncbi:SPOR domain-containing protein [Microvirga guangxiensis]|uniref:Sporulation related domain-containing protein n=1 Tax=Microvirga guangxiensis TaxID=549386 RepID=A0A1G5B3Q4_9HYPH|nr:SPOR domain-containing protein [Microvirga guangxiensis]SCX84742.1 Sporulation related domain-containing protein [Microvirga guangxiensis]
MSESVKPRFAVDLNEIERQLAQAGSSQVQPAAATRGDPLAELARIVGQDDPFQAILANDGSARPRQQPSAIDDLFATRDTVTPASRPASAQARHEGFEVPDLDLGAYAQPAAAPRSNTQAYGYQQPAQPQQTSYNQDAYARQDGYADEYYDDGSDNYAEAGYGQPERLDYPAVQKPKSRKGLIAVGAVLGAIVIGGGGTYLFSGSSGASGNGEPVLVQATAEPVKVQPQNPGGVEIPNQNKQIYERSQNTDTKVVNREEQPVDVAQAVRSNGGSAVADATGATVPGAASGARNAPNSLNLGEPRKVRTVTIRPDGSVVGAPEAANAHHAAASPVPAMTLPAAAQAASAQPKPAPATPVAVAATPAPKPAQAAPVEAPAAPAQQRVASAQPVPVAAPAAETATVTGGYAVQLGLANSETAAETAFTGYQRKYPDLEGMPSLIRKAEVNGNTIYRVRVGPMSREEASSLCSKLQGQGGQCFVAKN